MTRQGAEGSGKNDRKESRIFGCSEHSVSDRILSDIIHVQPDIPDNSDGQNNNQDDIDSGLTHADATGAGFSSSEDSMTSTVLMASALFSYG